jgi:hypothetical protein
MIRATFVLLVSIVGAGALMHADDPPAGVEGLDGWTATPVFTVGESVGGATPVGAIVDLEVVAADETAIEVLAVHQLAPGEGRPYDLGAMSLTGARLSVFTVSPTTLEVTAVTPLVTGGRDRAGNVLSSPGQISATADATAGFARFSNALRWDPALFGPGSGPVAPLLLLGEESGTADGHAHGGTFWAVDLSSGEIWAAPDLGRGRWSGICPVDAGDPDRVALLLTDSTAGAPLYLYLGTKSSGDFLAQNGLRGGQLYVWVAENGESSPDDLRGRNDFATGAWAALDARDVSKAGQPGYDDLGYKNDATLRAEAAALGAFGFARLTGALPYPLGANRVLFVSGGRGDYSPRDTFGTVYGLYTEFVFAEGALDTAASGAGVWVYFDSDDALLDFSSYYWIPNTEAWGMGLAALNHFGHLGLRQGDEINWNYAYIDSGFDPAYISPTSAAYLNHHTTEMRLDAIEGWMTNVPPQDTLDRFNITLDLAGAAAAYANGDPAGIRDALGVWSYGFRVVDVSPGPEALQPNPAFTGSELAEFIDLQFSRLEGPMGDLRLWWGGDFNLRRKYADAVRPFLARERGLRNPSAPSLAPSGWAYFAEDYRMMSDPSIFGPGSAASLWTWNTYGGISPRRIAMVVKAASILTGTVDLTPHVAVKNQRVVLGGWRDLGGTALFAQPDDLVEAGQLLILSTPAIPDLQCTAVTWSTEWLRDDRAGSVFVSIENLTNHRFHGEVEVAVYLSNDATLDDTDVLLSRETRRLTIDPPVDVELPLSQLPDVAQGQYLICTITPTEDGNDDNHVSATQEVFTYATTASGGIGMKNIPGAHMNLYRSLDLATWERVLVITGGEAATLEVSREQLSTHLIDGRAFFRVLPTDATFVPEVD